MTTIYLARDQRPAPAAAPIDRAWFGDMSLAKSDKEQAYKDVLYMAHHYFGADITLQKTPTFMGMLLLQHALPFNAKTGTPYHYETMPDGMIELIKSFSFPHRIENINTGPDDTSYQYDQRLAFLAFAGSVPVYHPDSFIADEKRLYVPYHEAFYLVDVTIPRDWQHIGLVPSSVGIGTSRIYPRASGAKFTTWLHTSEMALLDAYQWPYIIKKRMMFDEPSPGSRPLMTWRQRFIESIEKAEHNHSERGYIYRSCLRRMALQTIGMFGHTGVNTQKAVRTFDGNMEMTDGEEVQGLPRRWIHPEWAAGIYARSRAAATKMALQVPMPSLSKIVGDAVFTKLPLRIEDTGKVGAYRQKEAH